MSLSGLGYYRERRFVSLPLVSVRAHAIIKELGAQVLLKQTFSNSATTPIEALYVFPAPARASISGFVMSKQDGTRVVGVVQEKEEAKALYDAAVASGKAASLMQQHTSDVFQVSVGNIPPGQQVDIELTYSTELAEDEENDSTRFHLPVHIGARYGQAPWISNHPNRQKSFLNLTITIEATSPISKISCPSHTIATELGPDPTLPNAKDFPFANHARVSLTSDSPLDTDFVLAIRSAGLDAPRCVAERHPKDDTVALALSLVPRFTLPDVKVQEFIFLVDRSGSMDGARITAASKALTIMLRSLPHLNTVFQIASFGSHSSMLWPSGSQPYNQETLDAATSHVDGMRADYGGTETRSALAMCFNNRKVDRPTSVFILTDGDAWDVDGVFQEVKRAVGAAPSQAYLRVYCLGIGNSVSTAMCEGIARAGNGACMTVTENEASITGKIVRLLKAARTPMISNIKVDWGRCDKEEEEDFELVSRVSDIVAADDGKKKLNIFDETYDFAKEKLDSPPQPPIPVALPPVPIVQSSPARIQNLAPGVRLYAYAILRGKDIPQTVSLTGVTESGLEIALSIPVTLSLHAHAYDGPPVIHSLAARKIIQDFEDRRLDDPFIDDVGLLKRTLKAHIVRLGKTYAIVSTHTSFVAVDESGKNIAAGLADSNEPGDEEQDSSYGIRSKSFSSVVLKRKSNSGPPGGPLRPSMARGGRRPPPPRAPMPRSMPSSAPPAHMRRRAPPPPAARMNVDSMMERQRIITPEDQLEKLARIQAFDGGFKLDVLDMVSIDIDKASLPQGLKDEVVATIVAMAFITRILESLTDVDEKAPWEGLFDKAGSYVQATYHGEIDQLVAQTLKAFK